MNTDVPQWGMTTYPRMLLQRGCGFNIDSKIWQLTQCILLRGMTSDFNTHVDQWLRHTHTERYDFLCVCRSHWSTCVLKSEVIPRRSMHWVCCHLNVYVETVNYIPAAAYMRKWSYLAGICTKVRESIVIPYYECVQVIDHTLLHLCHSQWSHDDINFYREQATSVQDATPVVLVKVHEFI